MVKRHSYTTINYNASIKNLQIIPRGWTAAPMFVLIYNGRIFGNELAKLNTLNVINIKNFDAGWLMIIFLDHPVDEQMTYECALINVDPCKKWTSVSSLHYCVKFETRWRNGPYIVLRTNNGIFKLPHFSIKFDWKVKNSDFFCAKFESRLESVLYSSMIIK